LDLRQTFTLANEFKEGDLLVGGTTDAQVRGDARQAIGGLRIGDIAAAAFVGDGVTAALERSLNRSALAEISSLTIDALKQILLRPSSADWVRRYRDGLPSETIAAVVKVMTGDELSTVARAIFNPLPGDGIAIGAPGHFGSRIQPNSPADDEDEILLSVLEGLTYGCGDVVIGLNPASDDVETIVHGVNTPRGATAIISCASCTTNCITPVMEILGRRIGVKKAIMTTVHAYTASQAIVDTAHSRPRRGRAGGANLVPTSTGAAAATARALPEYQGRFDGVAVRAPVPVGSLADIVCVTARSTTVDEVNRLFAEEAETERYRGILGVTADPLVSSDVIKDPRASIVDVGMTQVVDGDLLKVMSWYDNEWGYSSQLVREALRIARTRDRQTATRER